MTIINLTLEQLYSVAKKSTLSQGKLSAFSGLEGQVEVGRVTDPQLVNPDGSAKESILLALNTLSDPTTITSLALLRPDSILEAGFYSPEDFEQLPPVAIVRRGEEIEMNYPAPIAEIVFNFMEGLLPYAEDKINLDIELPLDQTWIIWAMLDWIRFNKDKELPLVSIEALADLMEEPMMSLSSLAAYFRETLDLAKASKSQIKMACSVLVETQYLESVNDGYMPSEQIKQLGMKLDKYRSHLRLTNKVLKDGSVFEMKYWCIQGEDGLCLLWYEVDGLVQLLTLPIDKVILLIEQLIFLAEEHYL